MRTLQSKIPNTYQEATSSSEAAQWVEAIKEEFKAHEENHTWSLMLRTPDMKIIDSKWVFRIKIDEEGRAHRFKAVCERIPAARRNRLYRDVCPSCQIRFVASTSSDSRCEESRADAVRYTNCISVEMRFANGKLDETIYMEVPEGLDVGEDPRSVVCKLEKSLYGLKQSPRC